MSMRQWLACAENVRPLLPPSIVVSTLICGNGGQGVVYRGTVDGAEAAVKIYLPGQHLIRVEREVAALARLDCHSVVRLLESCSILAEGDQLPVVATQLVPGESLKDAIGRQRLASDEVGRLAYDVAAAIAALWEERIVHRDIKPDNILRRPNGRSCVIDLGVARHLGEASLTGQGMTWGTLGYFSPEQSRATRKLTCKSDLFSLGVVLVEAAIGEHPTGRDQARLLRAGLHRALPGESADWKHAGLLMDLLSPSPASRPLPSMVLTRLGEYAPAS